MVLLPDSKDIVFDFRYLHITRKCKHPLRLLHSLRGPWALWQVWHYRNRWSRCHCFQAFLVRKGGQNWEPKELASYTPKATETLLESVYTWLTRKASALPSPCRSYCRPPRGPVSLLPHSTCASRFCFCQVSCSLIRCLLSFFQQCLLL